MALLDVVKTRLIVLVVNVKHVLCRTLSAMFVLTVGACSDVERYTAQPDQCLRRELFQQCLTLIPAGPKTTVYNDWAEAVSECDKAAYFQSIRNVGQIAAECLP